MRVKGPTSTIDLTVTRDEATVLAILCAKVGGDLRPGMPANLASRMSGVLASILDADPQPDDVVVVNGYTYVLAGTPNYFYRRTPA